MTIVVAGEGLTDYLVIKNMLIGYFDDKNLPISRLLPKDKEPVGWGNVLKYISSKEFIENIEDADYCIVQIDSKECEDWDLGLKQIGDNASKVKYFIDEIIKVLIDKIGNDYEQFKDKIIFAVTVHELECWLLPFNTDNKAHCKKMVSCSTTIETLAKTRGFSIHQKHYREGRNYEELSKNMKKQKELLKKSKLNPSLAIFIDNLNTIFKNF